MNDMLNPQWIIEQLCKLGAGIDIDKLVASGKLVPRKAGWYEVKDATVMEDIGQLATAFASSPTRVRFSKKTAGQARKALKRVRVDLLRDAAARCEREGKKEAATICREILRERGVSDS